jgi:cytochrome c biogenesis protein CcdA/glutaredoxin
MGNILYNVVYSFNDNLPFWFPGENKPFGGKSVRPYHRNNPLLIGLLVVLGLLVNFWMVSTVQASQDQQETSNTVDIYMFWGDGCPHCAKAKPYFERLAKANPDIVLHFYEVWYEEANREYFISFAKAFDFEPTGVPTIFIGDKYWVGFNDQIESDIQTEIERCLKDGCVDAGLRIEGSPLSPTAEAETPSKVVNPAPLPDPGKSITLPVIGTIDLEHQSLFISTLLIAFVDGVNPCSIWVLTMLLALTLHTGSRKKILIIGLIFILVTALIYALFILGLFSVMSVIPFRGVIQVVVAVIAVIFGIINIKDYFWYKEGISLTISDDSKPGLYKKMRNVIDAKDSFWGLAGATVVMAAGVSLVEFSCTAGFPVLWTNLVNAQNVPWLTFLLLLLVYMIIYQLDELAIFFSAVFTLKASKLEEKEGRILKLIGGILMLTLAVVMLVSPEKMNSLSGSLVVFGIAFGGTLLVLLIHRVILPKLGIQIGTEGTKGKPKHSSKNR